MKQRSNRAVGIVSLVAAAFIADAMNTSSTTRRAAAEDSSDQVLVLVNGVPITQADLKVAMLANQVPEEQQPQAETAMLQSLIEQQLLRRYLSGRRVRPNLHQLDAQVNAIKELIQKRGATPEALLAKFGFDEKRLRNQLSLPLTWKAYVDRVTTTKSIREYWEQHRQEFDGTELRASHIIIKLGKDADEAAVATAESTLQGVREKILAREISFAEAASKHSDAPSKSSGGDVGFFPYRGRMPSTFSTVAFELKEGEISTPFRSAFGMHILNVTGRRPGQFSLEDVRSEVLQQLSADLRRDTIKLQRKKATIELKVPRTD
jgi:parvulin-like peptidyl-prolyl isomerase